MVRLALFILAIFAMGSCQGTVIYNVTAAGLVQFNDDGRYQSDIVCLDGTTTGSPGVGMKALIFNRGLKNKPIKKVRFCDQWYYEYPAIVFWNGSDNNPGEGYFLDRGTLKDKVRNDIFRKDQEWRVYSKTGEDKILAYHLYGYVRNEPISKLPSNLTGLPVPTPGR